MALTIYILCMVVTYIIMYWFSLVEGNNIFDEDTEDTPITLLLLSFIFPIVWFVYIVIFFNNAMLSLAYHLREKRRK